MNNGINLVSVPCWWDGSHERYKLCSDTSTSLISLPLDISPSFLFIYIVCFIVLFVLLCFVVVILLVYSINYFM